MGMKGASQEYLIGVAYAGIKNYFMETKRVYTINKGVNRPIEFRGLKAQYIYHLVGTVIGVVLGFAVLYIAGVSPYICLPLTLGLGGFFVRRVYRMSRTYGQYGLMKRSARKNVPGALRARSRKCFIQLYSDDAGRMG